MIVRLADRGRNTMGFRKLLSALGIPAPEIETVVSNPRVLPGEDLRCVVRVRGGGAGVDVERLRLYLVVRAEDREMDGSTAWRHPYTVATAVLDGFRVDAGETVVREVTLRLPWEMPLTHIRGVRLPGARVAVRTVLTIDGAADRGDFDEIEVHALPAQDAVMQAYDELGFRLHEAEVKVDVAPWPARMADRRTQPYWQEIDLFFPPAWNRGQEELETVFIAREDSLDAHPGGNPPVTFVYADQDPAAWKETLDRQIRHGWSMC
ncbi:sporulation protein [Streptomyces sp. NPDC058953]|uniref:sporulation protein n=1 Tax=unclassified Streptomyces TaxID=2593676 RepID=UPI00367CE96E